MDITIKYNQLSSSNLKSNVETLTACFHKAQQDVRAEPEEWSRRRDEDEAECDESLCHTFSDQLLASDQAAQAANYSNYDSLLPEINLIKRRLSRAH